MFEIMDIIENQDVLAREILDRMYPENEFDDYVTKKSIEDIQWLLLYIKEGYQLNNPVIVSNLIHWLKVVFKGVSIHPNEAEHLFNTTLIVLKETYNDEKLNAFLESIDLRVKDEFINQQVLKLNLEQKKYLDLLLQSKRYEAQQLIQSLLEDGVEINDIYLSIFQETMRQVGELWQNHEISVAVEHYCTSVTQYIMSNMYDKVLTNKKNGKRVIVCGVGSELHELGTRMVSDFFEMDGWETRYLGPNLPEKELAVYAKEFHPHVIAMSVTMPHHVSILKDTIKKLRMHDFLNSTKIIVGGLPFINQPNLAESIGADGVGLNAVDGVKCANELASQLFLS